MLVQYALYLVNRRKSHSPDLWLFCYFCIKVVLFDTFSLYSEHIHAFKYIPSKLHRNVIDIYSHPLHLRVIFNGSFYGLHKGREMGG